MTYQTDGPVVELPINITALSWGELVHMVQDGDMSYDLPYQRGEAWTAEQRIMLVYSVLSGTPVPALIINRRPDEMWFGPAGEQLPVYAVIDGKQRLTTVRMFMEGNLAVPASWFPADRVEATEDTSDGPYVRYPGLTRPAQRFFEIKTAPVGEARVRTVADEAAIYLRVNGSGTPQTTEDMTRAANVAGAR
jgi:hypothetical protein